MKSDKLTVDALASYFDHTCLKAYATNDDLIKLCNEAKEIKAAMVAINTEWVAFCKKRLKDTSVHVGAAIGFPLGQCALPTKVFETIYAIEQGADEIDYVIPGNDDAIRAVKLIAGTIANAILEANQGAQAPENAPEAPVEEDQPVE